MVMYIPVLMRILFQHSNIKTMQNNLRILSGLYGILKPLDLIQPYRLEMGTKIKLGKTNQPS